MTGILPLKILDENGHYSSYELYPDKDIFLILSYDKNKHRYKIFVNDIVGYIARFTKDYTENNAKEM